MKRVSVLSLFFTGTFLIWYSLCFKFALTAVQHWKQGKVGLNYHLVARLCISNMLGWFPWRLWRYSEWLMWISNKRILVTYHNVFQFNSTTLQPPVSFLTHFSENWRSFHKDTLGFTAELLLPYHLATLCIVMLRFLLCVIGKLDLIRLCNSVFLMYMI